LGKPIKGKTRLVVEFSDNNNLKPLNWSLVGIDKNRWKIKLFAFSKKPFQTIGEGVVNKYSTKSSKDRKFANSRDRSSVLLKLPEVKRDKFYVVIDPGHGGPDPGAIGIGGIRESDVVLDVSKQVKKLLIEKGVMVRLTRNSFFTCLETSRTTSDSLIPPIPIAPGSGPP
jgi:N-acetylmuramoyl-L-alanine amidase